MKIIVSYLDRQETYEVNPEVEDVFLAAARSAMEAIDARSDKKLTVPVVLICKKKGTKDVHFVNTYFALLAADMMIEANILRNKFRELYGVDVADEPVSE